MVTAGAKWGLFKQVARSCLINLLDFLAKDHQHVLFELNHIIWLISRVKNGAAIAVGFPARHSLLLEVLFKVLQEGVLIYNLREVADLPLVVVESDAKSGNITVTF